MWLGLRSRVLKIIDAELSQNNCGDRTNNNFVVIFIFQSARVLDESIQRLQIHTYTHTQTHTHTHTQTHTNTHTHTYKI